MGDRAIGVDIGGTKIVAGVVDGDGAIEQRQRRPTPVDDAATLVRTTVDVISELEAADAPVGVGVAGWVDLDGRVRTSPNVPGLVDEPIRERLEAELGSPVTVLNDADAAAWGEFCLGAGRDVDALAMFMVGTGVGGGLVLHGQLVRGAHGAAGELGHLLVDEGGPRCACGNHGCVEAHASGHAIARKAHERRDAGALAAGSPLESTNLCGEDVAAAAAGGDADALAVLADAGFWLGVGVASVVNAFDPATVVIGGGAAGAGEHLLEPARRACAVRVLGAPTRKAPPLVPGELADPGVIGAGLVARRDRSG